MMKKRMLLIFSALLLILCTVTSPAGIISSAAAKSVKDESAVSPETPVNTAATSENAALRASAIAMRNGQQLTLTVDTQERIKWSSSDKKVASVSREGIVTAKKVGSATITAKFGGREKKFRIKVKPPVAVSERNCSVRAGNSVAVTVMCWLEYTTVSYSISDPSVVSAKWENGWEGWTDGYNSIQLYLTGLSAGTATITLSNDSTKDKVKFKVKVSSSGVVYRALVIGNSEYAMENDLPNQKWDAAAMTGLLTGSVQPRYKVTKKLDCTADQILRAISSTFSGATRNDVSLFYYGGHGYAGSGSLCCVDGSAVWADELSAALQKIPGKVIVILDCCHSGSYITEREEDTPSPRSFNQSVIDAFSGHLTEADDVTAKSGELMMEKFIVLTSCAMDEESWNWWYYGNNQDQSFGTFTKALFKGLGCKWSSGVFSGSAPCDTNKDRIASLEECRSYTAKWATYINQQMGGNNVQNCMSYGDPNYPLFRLGK